MVLSTSKHQTEITLLQQQPGNDLRTTFTTIHLAQTSIQPYPNSDIMSIETTYSNKRIGDIVSENYNAAAIFREFGIDFCCGGGMVNFFMAVPPGAQAHCKGYGLAERHTHSGNRSSRSWFEG